MSAVIRSTSGAAPAATSPPTHAAGLAQGAVVGRLDIRDVCIHLGEGAQRFLALDKLDLAIAPGELVCLLGPSGCGKSTLLGALAGHLRPSSGSIALDGQPIAGPGPERGLVFQQHTLFPWLTVQDNVAYGLKMRGVRRKERRQQAQALLAQVGLAGFETRYPRQLSGGMQQRVEIARVLINQPRVLLMDEPFGALDALTRLKMQEMLLDLWARLRTTIVFVTHDIDEALFLADRIVVMSPRPGRLVEEIRVPAPRPRQPEILTTPEFGQLKRHCLELLRHPEGAGLERLSPLGLGGEGADPRRKADTVRFAV